MSYVTLSKDKIKQINQMLVSSVFLCVFLCAVFLFSVFSDSKTVSIVADGRINPNTASFHQLYELPGIGVKRAMGIIEYRDNAAGAGHGRVFSDADDLKKVKGIGSATLDSIKHLFVFSNRDD